MIGSWRARHAGRRNDLECRSSAVTCVRDPDAMCRGCRLCYEPSSRGDFLDDAKIMTYDRIRKLALLVVPGIVCLIGGICLHALAPVYSAPYYWYYLVSADPAYVYLFNGLSILFGVAPGHVDHPGTPVQLFVAFIILVKSVLTGTGLA